CPGMARLPAVALRRGGGRTLVLVDEGRRPPPRSTRRLVRLPRWQGHRLSRAGASRRVRPNSRQGRGDPPGHDHGGHPACRRSSWQQSASVDALLRLVMGGTSPGNRGTVLHCRVRYFDPDGRRPGLPPGVAALVEGMTADSTTLRLVNLCQTAQRTVIVQSGAYGEHVCDSVMLDGREVPVGSRSFSVRLAPGAGSQLVLKIRRYVNVPTLM